MGKIIDYQTNLQTSDDKTRAKEALQLVKVFGYLPVYGPTMPDVTTGKNLLHHILKKYPGYRWVIEVRGGVISVVNETLSHDWGFRLRENMLDNDGKVIQDFAGKLLEMYNMRQGAIDLDEVNSKDRNLRGDMIREQ